MVKCRAQSGQATVELTLALVVIVVLVASVIETGPGADLLGVRITGGIRSESGYLTRESPNPMGLES